MPAGICTVESNESNPFSASLFIGTPSTGRVVCAAITPARCAAPPAAAMITSRPRDSAFVANSEASRGLRCADMTRDSCATPNCASVSEAARMVSQSDLLPMRTATKGDGETAGRGDGEIDLPGRFLASPRRPISRSPRRFIPHPDPANNRARRQSCKGFRS